MPGNVTISTSVVPEGTCPPWIIARWPALVGLLSGNLNGALNVFNYGNAVPAPADQGKPWMRLNSNGTFDKWYAFSGGVWISPHGMATGLITLWRGDITTIDTFDGGAVAPITDRTGPMWKRVTDLDAKFPIGVGTLPSGAALALGATGGEENHVLTIPELAKHHHNVMVKQDAVGGSGGNRLRPDATAIDAVTDDVGNDMGHNTMPPYYALFFIERTARLYYRI